MDWRLDHLNTQPYLRGVKFRRAPYKAPRPGWDHDHCVGCWATFAEFESDKEQILHEGYATCDDYPKGAQYEWVCPECFKDFREVMSWVEV